jgi:hypothetical protein
MPLAQGHAFQIVEQHRESPRAGAELQGLVAPLETADGQEAEQRRRPAFPFADDVDIRRQQVEGGLEPRHTTAHHDARLEVDIEEIDRPALARRQRERRAGKRGVDARLDATVPESVFDHDARTVADDEVDARRLRAAAEQQHAQPQQQRSQVFSHQPSSSRIR